MFQFNCVVIFTKVKVVKIKKTNKYKVIEKFMFTNVLTRKLQLAFFKLTKREHKIFSYENSHSFIVFISNFLKTHKNCITLKWSNILYFEVFYKSVTVVVILKYNFKYNLVM